MLKLCMKLSKFPETVASLNSLQNIVLCSSVQDTVIPNSEAKVHVNQVNDFPTVTPTLRDAILNTKTFKKKQKNRIDSAS